MEFNTAIPFEYSWIEDTSVSLSQLNDRIENIISRGTVNSDENKLIWALKALTLTDLTTLSGDDTRSNVTRLCCRAAYPFTMRFLEEHFDKDVQSQIHTAAVCVYPARVADAYDALRQFNKHDVIPIAAVATGFPTGQYPLKTRLDEIDYAIKQGASEIDIVIDRQLALNEQWAELYDEIVQMRKVCSNRAHMKTILAIGELGTMENVYKASMVAMMAGSDFIKTSTGKESVNATLPVGLVMINAIQEFQRKTGRLIGLKPAGGVRTVNNAISWLILIKETLGAKWLSPSLFRFGASGLLDDIEKVVFNILLQQKNH